MKCSILEMDYKKNVMATMAWTNEWLNNTNDKNNGNKEYLFLIQKTKTNRVNFNFEIKRINILELATVHQQELGF